MPVRVHLACAATACAAGCRVARPASSGAHTIDANLLTLVAQVFMDAATAERPVTGRVRRPYTARQLVIGSGTYTGWPISPFVVAVWRDTQTVAHHPDQECCAATLYHVVLHFCSLAKNTAASLKNPFLLRSVRLAPELHHLLIAGMSPAGKALSPWLSIALRHRPSMGH